MASTTIPSTMRALSITKYANPSGYEVLDLPTPQSTSPDQVIVKVHAASINPVDMAGASGAFQIAISSSFPYKLGFDLSGTVASVGDSVKEFKVGDEVFCCLIFQDRGSIAEYASTSEAYLAHKPKNITHAEAASIPLVAMTVVQSFDKVPGGLPGKTVLIPAGLGGVGSVGCQIAKNVYGAAKVITTVSTEKFDKVDQLLGEGVVDQVIDYKKSDPLKVIPRGSIDFLFDTMGMAMSYLPLLSKKDGIVVSIHSLPSGKNLKQTIPETSAIIIFICDFVESISRFRASRYGVKYDSVLQKPNGSELRKIAGWIEEGKLKPVVGRTVKLENVQDVRAVCELVSKGRGGVGKVIVEI